MKLCNYNVKLNEAPNNNDAKCVTNIMLNEVPNSNDGMCIGNNVLLTAVDALEFSMADIYV